MMHTPELLDKKHVVDGKVDLLSNILLIDYAKIAVDDWILIDANTVMGLDKIARYCLGSEEYVWMLIKFNRLSNPFDLNEGDVIAIPNLTDFRQHSRWVSATSIAMSQQTKQQKQFASLMRQHATIAQKIAKKANFVASTNGNIIF